MVRRLIKEGANLAAKNSKDHTPLALAKLGGHRAIMALLIENEVSSMLKTK